MIVFLQQLYCSSDVSEVSPPVLIFIPWDHQLPWLVISTKRKEENPRYWFVLLQKRLGLGKWSFQSSNLAQASNIHCFFHFWHHLLPRYLKILLPPVTATGGRVEGKRSSGAGPPTHTHCGLLLSHRSHFQMSLWALIFSAHLLKVAIF